MFLATDALIRPRVTGPTAFNVCVASGARSRGPAASQRPVTRATANTLITSRRIDGAAPLHGFGQGEGAGRVRPLANGAGASSHVLAVIRNSMADGVRGPPQASREMPW